TEAFKKERAVGAVWSEAQFSVPNAMTSKPFGCWLKSNQVGVLDELNEVLQLTDRPWYEVRDSIGRVHAPSKTTGHGMMADLLQPAIRAAFEAHVRSLAVSRALRIDNALREFADKNGREATGLDDLSLPKEATID